MRENGAVRRGIQHIRECLRALLLRVLAEGKAAAVRERAAQSRRGVRAMSGKAAGRGEWRGNVVHWGEERAAGGSVLRRRRSGSVQRCAGRAGVRVFGAGDGCVRAYVRIIYNIAKFV